MSYKHIVILITLFFTSTYANAQQHLVIEKVAQKLIQKYQQSSCQDLINEKSQKPTGEKEQMVQNAIQMMHNDPQMRTAFINMVAAPIANEMFQCGMIP